MWKQFFAPNQLSEALEILERYRDQARIIAGGTDLVLDFGSRRYSSVEALVDISSIPELKKIWLENDVMHIGAAATLTEVLQSNVLQSRVPVLVEAARNVAGSQIRNIATIGGNIVNASPAADTTPPLLVLDSIVSIIGPGERFREIPLREFLLGNRKVDLRAGEIVTGFHFTLPDSEARQYFRKVQSRQSMAIAILNLAILLEVKDDQIEDVRIAMGAVAPTAVRIETVEKELRNLKIHSAVQPGQFAGVKEDINPISDFRASYLYRLKVAERLLGEAITGLLGLSEEELLNGVPL